MKNTITKKYLSDLTFEINGAAMKVHKEIGPGLLESVYHQCMREELAYKGLSFESEKSVTIQYRNAAIGTDLRVDLFVEDIMPVELKAVVTMHPVFEAQILTYMKLLKAPKGILYNFTVPKLYPEGLKTYVNELYRDLSEH